MKDKITDLKPVLSLGSDKMTNPEYDVEVWAYLLGQYRIQLSKGHPYTIVRECCTYEKGTALAVVVHLAASEDPEAYLESIAKPYNCEGPKGRIRLDNEPP